MRRRRRLGAISESAQALENFAHQLELIARAEGYDADPARRKAFAEIIEMARKQADTR